MILNDSKYSECLMIIKYVIKLRTLIDICMNEISVILILSFFFEWFGFTIFYMNLEMVVLLKLNLLASLSPA